MHWSRTLQSKLLGSIRGISAKNPVTSSQSACIWSPPSRSSRVANCSNGSLVTWSLTSGVHQNSESYHTRFTPHISLDCSAKSTSCCSTNHDPSSKATKRYTKQGHSSAAPPSNAEMSQHMQEVRDIESSFMLPGKVTLLCCLHTPREQNWFPLEKLQRRNTKMLSYSSSYNTACSPNLNQWSRLEAAGWQGSLPDARPKIGRYGKIRKSLPGCSFPFPQ